MNLAALRANWRTTLSGIGTVVFSLLAALAQLPYQLGDIATIIPPEWKEKVFVASALAAAALKVWNSIASKDAVVIGNGTVFHPVESPEPRDPQVNRTFLLLALASLALPLSGCVTDAQGKTRFDPATATRLLESGLEIYHRGQGAPGPVAAPTPALPIDTLYHQGAAIVPPVPAFLTNPANIVLRDAREP